MKRKVTVKKDKLSFKEGIKYRVGNKTFNLRKDSSGRYIFSGYEICPLNLKPVHRVVSEEIDGELPSVYHIHHCDFNKLNNSPDNLVQIPSDLHKSIHESYTYKPSKKEILEKILPNFLELKKSIVHKPKEEIIRDFAVLARMTLSHPDKEEILKKARKLIILR